MTQWSGSKIFTGRGDLISLIAQRSWLSLSGFITVIVLPATVTNSEQGLFFSFLSIAALQSIFEAGITSIFVNFCAHEKAALGSGPSEDARALARIAAIAEAASRWFLLASLAFFLVVGCGGLYYLQDSLGPSSEFGRWQPAYLLLIAAVGCSLFNLSRISVLEGLGHMGDIARIRLCANVLSAVILWASLAAGLGVWALSLSYVAQSFVVIVGSSRLAGAIPRPAKAATVSPLGDLGISWKRDILPLQTKLGISYFCGYLVSQAMIPFSLRYYGPVAAGQIGFANAIFSAAASVLASLIYLSGPRYAQHITRNHWAELEKMFRSTTSMSLVIGVAAYAGLAALLISLGRYAPFFSGRIPQPSILVMLGLIGLANIYIGSAATLMRAFKKEPMLPASIAAALLYGVAMFIAYDASPESLFVAMTVAQLLFILPLTALIKQRFLASNTAIGPEH